MASRWFGSSASASRSQPTARALRLCRVVNSERMSRAARNFSSAGLTRSAGPASTAAADSPSSGRPASSTNRPSWRSLFSAAFHAFAAAHARGATATATNTITSVETHRAREPARDIAPGSRATANPRSARHFTLSTGMTTTFYRTNVLGTAERREKIPYTRVFDLHQMGP